MSSINIYNKVLNYLVVVGKKQKFCAVWLKLIIQKERILRQFSKAIIILELEQINLVVEIIIV